MKYFGTAGILDIFLRCTVSIIVLFVLTRIMGKKQISQLTFFDYVIGISIGSISAALAVDESISYTHGIAALVIYAVFPIAVSYITLKSNKGRMLLGGKPTILIQNGKLMEKNIQKSRFNINDILEECRLKGAFSFQDVEFAILETSGKVSVQMKPPKQPATREDLGISTGSSGISAELIIDGQIIEQNLKLVNHDRKWLLAELEKQKAGSPEQVLLATLDNSGRLTVDLKNHDPQLQDVIL